MDIADLVNQVIDFEARAICEALARAPEGTELCVHRPEVRRTDDLWKVTLATVTHLVAPEDRCEVPGAARYVRRSSAE